MDRNLLRSAISIPYNLAVEKTLGNAKVGALYTSEK